MAKTSWIHEHPQQAWTTFIVVAVHLVGIVATTMIGPPPTVLIPRGKVVVKTIGLHPKKLPMPPPPAAPQNTVAAAPEPAAPAPAAADEEPDDEEEAPPEPKKEEKKSAVKVTKTPPKKTVVEKAKPQKKTPAKKAVAAKKPGKKPTTKKNPNKEALAKQKDLVKQALAGLDKAKNASKGAGAKGKASAAAATPSAAYGIGDNSLFDSATQGVDPAFWGYCEELVNRLQLMLRLPEYGEVKVLVTIDVNGGVKKVSIKESKSPLNKSYIEKNMPLVAFPSFGSNFPGEKDHTFYLALTSGA